MILLVGCLFFVSIASFLLMSHCLFSCLCFVLCSFIICITTSPSIFMLLFFFPFLLPFVFFLLFKQIKRFLLNMQAIVSSPSHDFTLRLFHAVCACVSLWLRILTSVLARGTKCVRRFALRCLSTLCHLIWSPAKMCLTLLFSLLMSVLVPCRLPCWLSAVGCVGAGSVLLTSHQLHNSLLQPLNWKQRR